MTAHCTLTGYKLPICEELQKTGHLSPHECERPLPRRIYPDAEGTRSPIFLLQSRKWHCNNVDDYDYRSDLETLLDADGVEVDEAYMKEHSDDWSDYWQTESVWFTREEAETFGASTHYRYKHGHRVYCLCAEGDLATIIGGLTDADPTRWLIGTQVRLTEDSGETTATKTRSTPWQLGDGHWVVLVVGKTGGYSVSRMEAVQ